MKCSRGQSAPQRIVFLSRLRKSRAATPRASARGVGAQLQQLLAEPFFQGEILRPLKWREERRKLLLLRLEQFGTSALATNQLIQVLCNLVLGGVTRRILHGRREIQSRLTLFQHNGPSLLLVFLV